MAVYLIIGLSFSIATYTLFVRSAYKVMKNRNKHFEAVFACVWIAFSTVLWPVNMLVLFSRPRDLAECMEAHL